MHWLEILQKPLSVDQVDFRIQSINKGGYATILAYKDARVDMHRLDEAFTPLGWKREHLNGNANCIVSVWNDQINQWVSKEDTGVESNAEAQKGLASDSFKRACFNWGIGRELYDYPVISVKLHESSNPENPRYGEWYLENSKARAGWGLKLKEWTWFTQFDETGALNYIAAKDQDGNIRFTHGKYVKPEQKPQPQEAS